MRARRWCLPVVFGAALLAGCGMPDGMNGDCQWPPRGVTTAQPSDRHLTSDLRVAEELAIRYADRRHSRTATRAQWRTALRSCEGKLFEIIAREHAVSPSDAAVARARLAGFRFDPVTHIPLLAAFLITATRASRLVTTRFRREDGAFRLLAFVFVTLAASASLVAVGGIWSAAVEMLRVGNLHMSYRAHRIPWGRHLPELFATSMVMMLTAVLVRDRQQRAD